jgi:hypothetical protein
MVIQDLPAAFLNGTIHSLHHSNPITSRMEGSASTKREAEDDVDTAQLAKRPKLMQPCMSSMLNEP